MTQSAKASTQQGPPANVAVDNIVVNDPSPDTVESAEAIGWKEAKLTLATLVFFGVPLLIASAQIATNDYLISLFETQAQKSSFELWLLHIGAVIVTSIGLISAIVIVATSCVRICANFIHTCRDIGVFARIADVARSIKKGVSYLVSKLRKATPPASTSRPPPPPPPQAWSDSD